MVRGLRALVHPSDQTIHHATLTFPTSDWPTRIANSLQLHMDKWVTRRCAVCFYPNTSVLSGPVPHSAGPSRLQPIQTEPRPSGDWRERPGARQRWPAGARRDSADCGSPDGDLETPLRLSASSGDFFSAHWLPLLLHQCVTLQLAHGERYHLQNLRPGGLTGGTHSTTRGTVLTQISMMPSGRNMSVHKCLADQQDSWQESREREIVNQQFSCDCPAPQWLQRVMTAPKKKIQSIHFNSVSSVLSFFLLSTNLMKSRSVHSDLNL